jgi:hypothetical protein
LHLACRSALKNLKFTQALVDVIKEAGVTEGCPKAKGNLLYTTASKVSELCLSTQRQQSRHQQLPQLNHLPGAVAAVVACFSCK